jgi:pilus assembly protein CpaB
LRAAIATRDRKAELARWPVQTGFQMNRRLLMVLLVAFVIAAICTLLVYRLVSNRVTAAQPVPTTSVVAAKTDIKLGTILTADNLTTIGITGLVPKGVILEKDKSNVLGRGVISDLYAGEPQACLRPSPRTQAKRTSSITSRRWARSSRTSSR